MTVITMGIVICSNCCRDYRLWATALHSGNNETGFEHNSTCALFSIGIELTDGGFTHLYEVQTYNNYYVYMCTEKSHLLL
jgi:hypothetical protein